MPTALWTLTSTPAHRAFAAALGARATPCGCPVPSAIPVSLTPMPTRARRASRAALARTLAQARPPAQPVPRAGTVRARAARRARTAGLAPTALRVPPRAPAARLARLTVTSTPRRLASRVRVVIRQRHQAAATSVRRGVTTTMATPPRPAWSAASEGTPALKRHRIPNA